MKKQEIINTIDVLVDINKTIKENNQLLIEKDVIDNLGQCQEIALGLGTYLESLRIDVEEMIKLLEGYCEQLYQMSTVFSNSIKCKNIADIVDKQLSALKKLIISKLPKDKKEIVFLPYKASMWDSLESIWQAAAEDQSCETYVIPIPYFDKNPDGTLGEMHYEGNEYPDYVPITSWKEYNLEARKPDVIYIHNPYDQCNAITSIHPAFYAIQLKKYTNMLVYIPYFISPDDEVPVHLCVLPGTFLADKVIVQSEKVRRIYISQMKKYERENNCKGAFGNVERKVVVIGSPKYDKVININKDRINVPAEWLEIITKEDGSHKKVVLYNVSVNNLLEFGEKMLLKIKDTLKVFNEKREEIALLWRPHPLIESTLKAIYPDLLMEYQDIVKKYCIEKWGIYDNTSDMTRAIAVSDAYYGDGGSLLELYKITGKPIMLQKCEMYYSKSSNY